MAYPTNNTYNQYHENVVDLIINDDTRLVSAYFNLSAADMLNLRLSNTIYVNGVNYIINKIQDFDLKGRRLTKVELITK